MERTDGTGLLSMKERQTEKHAHATRLTTIAKSVVTTIGRNFFRPKTKK